MNTQRMMGLNRFPWILSISLVLFSSVTILSNTARADCSAVAESDGAISKSTKAKHLKPTEGEIRFEFSPKSPVDLKEYYSVFMVINQNGNARALRYGLRFQAKNVAAYEGRFSEAEVQRLFARVRAAFRLPKYRNDDARHLIYEDNSFYLAIKSDSGKVKEMFGGDGPRPDEVQVLLAEMSEWWKKLSEVPPAYAYVTSWPIEKDRLRALRRQGPSRLTPIESLPSTLQSLLISVVTQTFNFYPLPKDQYDQIQRLRRPMTYKGRGYDLSLFLSVEEAAPIQKLKSKQ